MYSASKHAVLGFTDAFRQEIEEAKLPISVTLVKPAAINTPFARHAKNYYDQESTLPAPVYAPELVADQILHAATHPSRELYVGGGGRLMALIGQHFPGLTDWVMSKTMGPQQFADRPANHENESLYESRGMHTEHGDIDKDRMVRQHSAYNVATRHPMAVTMIAAAAAGAVGYLLFRAYEHGAHPSAHSSARERAEQAVRRNVRRNLAPQADRVVGAVKHRVGDWFN